MFIPVNNKLKFDYNDSNLNLIAIKFAITMFVCYCSSCVDMHLDCSQFPDILVIKLNIPTKVETDLRRVDIYLSYNDVTTSIETE